MKPVAEIYDDLLKQIGPLGVTGHSCSWLYQLTPAKRVNIICGKEIAVEVTNTEIRFHIHRWHTRDGSLSSMPYDLRYNVKSNGKTAGKGGTYIVQYEGLEAEIKANDFAIYTDSGGLRANAPAVNRKTIPERRTKVMAYIRHSLLAPFAAAKVVGPVKTASHWFGEPLIVEWLAAGNHQAIAALADSRFVRTYRSDGYDCKANPRKEVDNYINRNKAAIYEKFGVYEGMDFVEPPTA